MALDAVQDAAGLIAALRRQESKLDPDQVEGAGAALLYEALEKVDPAALEDPGFWRFLSVGIKDFFEFIRWREEKAFGRGEAYWAKYVDGTKPMECVLTRMALRIEALGGRGDSKRQYRELAGAIPKATDFWRSHVIRVGTNASPALVRAFARMQLDPTTRLGTKPLRKFAKTVNRVRTNVVFRLYDDAEADACLRELRDEVLPRKRSSQ